MPDRLREVHGKHAPIPVLAHADAARTPGSEGRGTVGRATEALMIETRKLGQGDARVGAIALGAMAFAGWYDTRDDEAGVQAIQRALDAGITLIDTAEAYGS